MTGEGGMEGRGRKGPKANQPYGPIVNGKGTKCWELTSVGEIPDFLPESKLRRVANIF